MGYNTHQTTSLPVATSFIWLQQAADQGVANAQVSLGWMYLTGLGVEQDLQRARSWYRKASLQGNEQAKKALREGFRAE